MCSSDLCYKDERYEGWWPVPQYHGSTAAIHAAEAALPVELRASYTNTIRRAISLAHDDNTDFALIHASAEQRATAMIAVLERAKEAME